MSNTNDTPVREPKPMLTVASSEAPPLRFSSDIVGTLAKADAEQRRLIAALRNQTDAA